MQIDAYLFFPGNASEAMEFYAGVFGGELTVTRRGDVDPGAPDDEKLLVVNAALNTEHFRFRAADRTDAGAGPQHRVALSLVGVEEELLRAVFEGLAAGGSVDQPLERQFWGDIFGAVTDRFGISWQVNIEADG